MELYLCITPIFIANCHSKTKGSQSKSFTFRNAPRHWFICILIMISLVNNTKQLMSLCFLTNKEQSSQLKMSNLLKSFLKTCAFNTLFIC